MPTSRNYQVSQPSGTEGQHENPAFQSDGAVADDVISSAPVGVAIEQGQHPQAENLKARFGELHNTWEDNVKVGILMSVTIALFIVGIAVTAAHV